MYRVAQKMHLAAQNKYVAYWYQIMTYQFRNLTYLLVLTKNVHFRLVKLPFFAQKSEFKEIVEHAVRRPYNPHLYQISVF